MASTYRFRLVCGRTPWRMSCRFSFLRRALLLGVALPSDPSDPPAEQVMP